VSTEPAAAQLAALALHNAVPTIFQNREFAAAGGLISADLPVVQSTKFELVIWCFCQRIIDDATPCAQNYYS
jgi:hypothetical protein